MANRLELLFDTLSLHQTQGSVFKSRQGLHVLFCHSRAGWNPE